jgi:putative ABC transport system permease protein
VARKFFPDGNAIGRRMWGMRATARPFDPPPQEEMLTVVGVVAEMRLGDVVDDPGVRSNGACYYPFRQRPARMMGLAIRTAGEPTGLAAAVRRVLAGVDPELPLYDVDTVERLIDRSLIDRRTPAVLAAGFALVALVLAMLGVYGVLAWQVSRRTRELGIRMALGADSRRIFGLVLGEGALITGAGMLAGFLGAMLLLRTIQAQLYGVGRMESFVLIAIVVLVGLTALVATAIPARRAARTDPAVVLTDV